MQTNSYFYDDDGSDNNYNYNNDDNNRERYYYSIWSENNNHPSDNHDQDSSSSLRYNSAGGGADDFAHNFAHDYYDEGASSWRRLVERLLAGAAEVRIDYSVLSVAVMTLGLIMIVELFRHKLDHTAAGRPLFVAVLETLYAELATLGMVEFAIHVMHKYWDDLDIEKEQVFAAVHFTLFYTAVLNALQSALMAVVAFYVARRNWVQTERLELNHYVEIREEYQRVRDELQRLNNRKKERQEYIIQQKRSTTKKNSSSSAASNNNNKPTTTAGNSGSPNSSASSIKKETATSTPIDGVVVNGETDDPETNAGRRQEERDNDDNDDHDKGDDDDDHDDHQEWIGFWPAVRAGAADVADFVRYPALKRKHTALLLQVRYHELRVYFLQAYNLPLKLKISDYLLRSQLHVLLKMVHVTIVAWLLLTALVNLLYFIMGVVATYTFNPNLVGTCLIWIYYCSMFLCCAMACFVWYRMAVIFHTIMHRPVLWDVVSNNNNTNNNKTEKKKKDASAGGGDQDNDDNNNDDEAEDEEAERRRRQLQQEELAQQQRNLFWGGDPKLVIAAIQFMNFAYGFMLAVILEFWETIDNGGVGMEWFLLVWFVSYAIFCYVIAAKVIPQYTLCTSLGQLVDLTRLHETVALFHLEQAKRKQEMLLLSAQYHAEHDELVSLQQETSTNNNHDRADEVPAEEEQPTNTTTATPSVIAPVMQAIKSWTGGSVTGGLTAKGGGGGADDSSSVTSGRTNRRRWRKSKSDGVAAMASMFRGDNGSDENNNNARDERSASFRHHPVPGLLTSATAAKNALSSAARGILEEEEVDAAQERDAKHQLAAVTLLKSNSARMQEEQQQQQQEAERQQKQRRRHSGPEKQQKSSELRMQEELDSHSKSLSAFALPDDNDGNNDDASHRPKTATTAAGRVNKDDNNSDDGANDRLSPADTQREELLRRRRSRRRRLKTVSDGVAAMAGLHGNVDLTSRRNHPPATLTSSGNHAMLMAELVKMDTAALRTNLPASEQQKLSEREEERKKRAASMNQWKQILPRTRSNVNSEDGSGGTTSTNKQQQQSKDDLYELSTPKSWRSAAGAGAAGATEKNDRQHQQQQTTPAADPVSADDTRRERLIARRRSRRGRNKCVSDGVATMAAFYQQENNKDDDRGGSSLSAIKEDREQVLQLKPSMSSDISSLSSATSGAGAIQMDAAPPPPPSLLSTASAPVVMGPSSSLVSTPLLPPGVGVIGGPTGGGGTMDTLHTIVEARHEESGPFSGASPQHSPQQSPRPKVGGTVNGAVSAAAVANAISAPPVVEEETTTTATTEDAPAAAAAATMTETSATTKSLALVLKQSDNKSDLVELVEEVDADASDTAALEDDDEDGHSDVDDVPCVAESDLLLNRAVLEQRRKRPPLTVRDWFRAFYSSKRSQVVSNVMGTMVVFFLIGQRVERFLRTEGIVSDAFIAFDLDSHITFWGISVWFFLFLISDAVVFLVFRPYSTMQSNKQRRAVAAAVIDVIIVGACLTVFYIAEARRCCYPSSTSGSIESSSGSGGGGYPNPTRLLAGAAPDKGDKSGGGYASSSAYDDEEPNFPDPAPCACPRFGSRKYGGLGSLEPYVSLIALRIFRYWLAVRIVRHMQARNKKNNKNWAVVAGKNNNADDDDDPTSHGLKDDPFAVFGETQHGSTGGDGGGGGGGDARHGKAQHETGTIVELWESAISRHPDIVAKHGEFSGELLQAMLGVPIIAQQPPGANKGGAGSQAVTTKLDAPNSAAESARMPAIVEKQQQQRPQQQHAEADTGQDQNPLSARSLATIHSAASPTGNEAAGANDNEMPQQNSSRATVAAVAPQPLPAPPSAKARFAPPHAQSLQQQQQPQDDDDDAGAAAVDDFVAPDARLVRSMRRCDRKLFPLLEKWIVVDVVVTRFEIVYFDASNVDDASSSNTDCGSTTVAIQRALTATKGGKALRLGDVACGRKVVGSLQLSDIVSVHVERLTPTDSPRTEFGPNQQVTKNEYWQKQQQATEHARKNRATQWHTTVEDRLKIHTVHGHALYFRFYSDLENAMQNPQRVQREIHEEDSPLYKNNAFQWVQTIGRFCGPEQLKQPLPHFGDDSGDELRDYLVWASESDGTKSGEHLLLRTLRKSVLTRPPSTGVLRKSSRATTTRDDLDAVAEMAGAGDSSGRGGLSSSLRGSSGHNNNHHNRSISLSEHDITNSHSIPEPRGLDWSHRSQSV